MKKTINMLMVAVLSLSTSTVAFAGDTTNSTPSTESTPITRAAYYEIWKIKSAKYVNSTYGSYKHLTTLGPADATGEYFSISESIGVDVSLSGPLHVGKSAIESALGFSLSAEVNVAITKNSRPLQKGESIIVDYRFKNNKYKVVQACTIHMDGQTIDGGTAELTVTKPDPFADVQFTYVNKNGKAYRAESYKAYPNGTLKLVSTNNL